MRTSPLQQRLRYPADSQAVKARADYSLDISVIVWYNMCVQAGRGLCCAAASHSILVALARAGTGIRWRSALEGTKKKMLKRQKRTHQVIENAGKQAKN